MRSVLVLSPLFRYTTVKLFSMHSSTAPNFLKGFEGVILSPLSGKFLVRAVFGSILSLLVYFFAPSLFMLVVIGSLVATVVVRPWWWIYILGTVAFFYGWVIDFSRYDWAIGLPIVSHINAPVIDIIAFGAVGAIGLGWVLGLVPISLAGIKKYALLHVWYGVFLVAGVIAAFSDQYLSVPASLWYWIRMMVTPYVFFVLVPLILFERRERLIEPFLRVLYWVGCGIAVYGLWSLGLTAIEQADVIRVTPQPILGFFPLGRNHNMVGEVLTVLSPIALYLGLSIRPGVVSRRYLFGYVLMVVVGMLTLSRSFWIALFLQIGLLYIWRHTLRIPDVVTKYRHQLLQLVIGGFGLIGAYVMYFLFFSPVPELSYSSRALMLDISWFHFVRAPWFGYGPGSFIEMINSTDLFTMLYGEPLDAHGIIQKLLVETGLLGTIPFFLFIGTLLIRMGKQAWQTHGTLLVKMLFLSVIGILSFELFSTSYFTSIMWLPIGVLLVVGLINHESK